MENYVDVQSYGNTPYVEFLTGIFTRVYDILAGVTGTEPAGERASRLAERVNECTISGKYYK